MLEIWKFIKDPEPLRNTKTDFKSKLRRFKKAFFFLLITLIIYTLILSALDKIFKYFDLNISVFDLKDTTVLNKLTAKYSIIQLWVITAIMAPIWEEIEFRLLLRPTRLYIAVSLSLFYLLHSGSISFKTEKFLNEPAVVAFSLIQAIFIGLFIYYILSESLLETLSYSKFKLMVWGSVIVFTYVHLKNYGDLNFLKLLLSPVLLLYVFIVGWLLSYLRIRNGFLWCVAFHALHNCLINSIKGF